MYLVINTALPVRIIALCDTTQTLKFHAWSTGRQDGDTLLNLLETWKADVLPLDGVIVVRGPGSYTGLRVAITIANTLAHERQVPLWGVTTFEYLAACTTSPDRTLIFPAGALDVWIQDPSTDSQICPLRSIAPEDEKSYYGYGPSTRSLKDLRTPTEEEIQVMLPTLLAQVCATPSSTHLLPLYGQAPHITTPKHA